MYLCYIDESGTSSIPGNTSHFVLAGISVPIWHWTNSDSELNAIKRRYALEQAEIHTAWMLRPYLEQSRITDFAALNYEQRRYEVNKARNRHLLALQQGNNPKRYRQAKKNYKKTEAYIHLSLSERKKFISEIADCVGGWRSTRLFAECIDKLHFDPTRSLRTVDEQAFEQIVSRFEHYLEAIQPSNSHKVYGLLIHDNNETVAMKHTRLMQHFHTHGTLWTQIQHIIETPLFVNSELTGLVQVADLCGYALRRYIENAETDLFDRIYTRADRRNDKVVGVRHFTSLDCTCQICVTHRGS